jgi:hypothetical protein
VDKTKVFIVLLAYKSHQRHSFETLGAVNKFFFDEVVSRDIELVFRRDQSDVCLFLPTWMTDCDSLAMYDKCKQENQLMVFSLEELDGMLKGACND